MKRYQWWNPESGWTVTECERLELSDNRVAFIGPDGAYLSMHNDEVRILRKEL